MFLILLASCAGSLPEPTQADADMAAKRWPGTDINFLHHGRKLYIAKCSGCHSLYQPKLYTETQWDTIMVTMRKKAKLNDQQYDDIKRFLTVMSKDPGIAAAKH